MYKLKEVMKESISSVIRKRGVVYDILKGLVLSIGIIAFFKILFAAPTQEFVGLFGVLSGGLISYLTIKASLRHTSSENKIQRSIELKKAIYFEASESFAKMRAMLISIPNMDLQKNEADINMINGLQKLDLIAEIELINKIIALSSYYQTAIQEMICDKLVIDTMDNNAKYALGRHSEYLDILRLNPQESYNLKQPMENCLIYHERIIDTVLHKRIELVKKSIQHTCKFGSLLSDCLPLLRKDIENAFAYKDEQTYKILSSNANKEALEKGEKFLEDIKNKMKDIDLPNL